MVSSDVGSVDGAHRLADRGASSKANRGNESAWNLDHTRSILYWQDKIGPSERDIFEPERSRGGGMIEA